MRCSSPPRRLLPVPATLVNENAIHRSGRLLPDLLLHARVGPGDEACERSTLSDLPALTIYLPAVACRSWLLPAGRRYNGKKQLKTKLLRGCCDDGFLAGR